MAHPREEAWRRTRFTDDELHEYREAFDVFDRNRDGRITAPELKDMMIQLGQEVTDKELKDIMTSVDKSRNGYIDFDSFCYIMHTCAPRSIDEQLREAFNLIHKDGTQKITSVDLKAALRRIGDTEITDDEIEELIREIDLDGDGMVDFEEFVKIMLAKT